MKIITRFKEWLIKKLLKILSKEISEIELELREEFNLKFEEAKAAQQALIDRLHEKIESLVLSLTNKEEEMKLAIEKFLSVESELKKYIISSILQTTVNRVVREVEAKFPNESGEFKRAQALRSVMQIHPEAPERDIAYAIEIAVREFQR